MGGALLGGLLGRGSHAPAAVVVVEPVAERRNELEELYPGLQTVVAPEPGLLDERRGRTGCRRRAGGEARPGRGGVPRCSALSGVRPACSRSWPACRASAWRPRSAASRRSSGPCPTRRRSIGAGVAAMSGGSFVTLERAGAGPKALSGSLGTVVRLPERLLDAVTGLSGSGPAYFFLVAEALIEGGVQMGLPREVSRTLVVQTMARLGGAPGRDGPRPGVAAGRRDVAGGDDRGRRPRARVPRRALGLHGGGGGRHRTLPQPAALSAQRELTMHRAEPARSRARRPSPAGHGRRARCSSSPTSGPRTSSSGWCTR